MIYRSNITAPDLQPNFKHVVSRPMGHSFGHDVLSDWSDKSDDDPVFGHWKNCGFWTHDEAAILYECARRCKGEWLDIGCNVGWTTSHIAAAATATTAVDYMLGLQAFLQRFEENANHVWANIADLSHCTSDEFFRRSPCRIFDGACIDGDHTAPQPLVDAQNAAAHLADTGVIMFHDGTGQPVRDAVAWLISQGFKARAYWTPYLVFCCWRGDFTPPDHTPDPLVKAAHNDGRYPDFDWSKCV